MNRMTRRRILRSILGTLGTACTAAGAAAVAVGKGTPAIVLAGVGSALGAAALAINLGEFNDPAHNAPVPAGSPPPAAGFARVGILILLSVVVLGALTALAGCGPSGDAASAPPAYDGAVAPGGAVSLAHLVAAPSGGLPVTWTVDAGGGSVTSAGVYTAPGCSTVLAALGAVDLSQVGQIAATDVVHASWAGGAVDITVHLQESVVGLEVVPSSVSVSPGEQVQFRAVIHYTCHNQAG